MKRIRVFLLLIILVGGGLSFIVFFGNQAPATPERVWPINGWSTSSPEKQGMNSSLLDAMEKWVEDSGVKVDSVLVVRHGYMVYERYFNPSYGVNSTHILHSVSKSFTSAIVGVAVDRGLIHLNDKVLDYFPEMTIQNKDPWKEEMTIKDLLTMTAGFQWDEWSVSYDNPMNDLVRMRTSSDPYQYLLDRPMVAKPGEKWVYNTGITDLLTEISRRATGSDFLEYGAKNIFEPLNFTRYHWLTDAWGRYLGGSALCLTTRDMAKFGYLFLNNGTWNGKVVLSSDWVSESVSPISEIGTGSGYGYQWWSYPDLGVYYASGRHEQSIYVAPKLDLVVAITASVSDEHSNVYSVDNRLLLSYILPACHDFTQTNLTYSRDNVTIRYLAGSYIRYADNESIHRFFGFYSNEYFFLIYGRFPGYEDELNIEGISLVFGQMLESASDYKVGDFMALNSSGRKVMLQPFNMTLSGVSIEGINSYWYCSETSQHFFFFYGRAEETSGRDTTMSGFRSYIDSITCH